MLPIIDNIRGKQVAQMLYHRFNTVGIHGRNDMPEDILPIGIKAGSLEHVLFITLSVAIDYQRDAPTMWESSRQTFEDPETKYLFDPKSLSVTSFVKIVEDMQKYKLSKKMQRDADFWHTIGVSFYNKWDGDPINFLKDCNWDSLTILERLKKDIHIENGEAKPDYPNLRGPKIGPLWLRMLRDNIGIQKIANLDKVPIPVDRHIARATLTTGVVRGNVRMNLNHLFKYIRKAWFESVMDLKLKNRDMIGLDMDEPLWHLSKYGCIERDPVTGNCPLINSCDAKDFCIKGSISIEDNIIDLNT